MKVIGIEEVDYISKKTNKQVTGCTLYLSEPITKGVGEKVTDAFFSTEKMNQWPAPVSLGDHVTIYYNRFGSPEMLVHVNA